MKEEALKVIHTILQEARTGKIIDKTKIKEVISKLVEEIISKHQDSLINLIDIRSHDKYTFSHSINVCTLAALIGIKEKLKRNELEDLALGAILHDVGKTMISQKILEKPERLSVPEFEEIKKHPVYGYNILSEGEEISEISRMIVYTHHERYDGGGYPQGLTGDKIPQLAVVTSLADVYDALTTDRPYRKSLLPYDAMRIIISHTYSNFSEEAVRFLLKVMSIYPLGSLVKLNTKEIGLVIKVNEHAIVRPTIRILIDSQGEIVSPSQIKDVNLSEDTSMFVVESVSEDVFAGK
ncbi:MAG: HD-GYP domain-containing protein [Nitrospirota bacterium]